jgi:hypothetical protein
MKPYELLGTQSLVSAQDCKKAYQTRAKDLQDLPDQLTREQVADFLSHDSIGMTSESVPTELTNKATLEYEVMSAYNELSDNNRRTAYYMELKFGHLRQLGEDEMKHLKDQCQALENRYATWGMGSGVNITNVKAIVANMAEGLFMDINTAGFKTYDFIHGWELEGIAIAGKMPGEIDPIKRNLDPKGFISRLRDLAKVVMKQDEASYQRAANRGIASERDLNALLATNRRVETHLSGSGRQGPRHRH